MYLINLKNILTCKVINLKKLKNYLLKKIQIGCYSERDDKDQSINYDRKFYVTFFEVKISFVIFKHHYAEK